LFQLLFFLRGSFSLSAMTPKTNKHGGDMRSNTVVSKRTNVVVCDPCPLIFSGLQKNFEDDHRIRFVGESPNLRALRQKIAAGGVNIALVDWSMVAWHDHECIQLVQEICAHALLVLLGMTETTRDRKRALEFGARGIISKRSSAHQVKKALHRVSDGGIWLEKSAAETLLDHVFLPPSGPQDELRRIELLTRREREVIALVCRSLRNKEIASALFISESTVWHHLTSIFGKLHVGDRVSLVTFAFRHDLSSYMDHPANSKPQPIALPASHARSLGAAAEPESPLPQETVRAERIA
jgi:DNA-binding NarL/FixJ family response regulator